VLLLANTLVIDILILNRSAVEELALIAAELLMINQRHDIVEAIIHGIRRLCDLGAAVPSRQSIIVELWRRFLGHIGH
jgi:hypothetical protein